jgi:hypothetical protein
MLLAAIEAKSQVGPSFGNNFNNRTEEAMGSALDLWTAYRERAYLASPQPFLGYFFMLEDCDASNRPVRVKEPHFKVSTEFGGASYMRRYEIFCRKLVLERHYTAAAYISSTADDGVHGCFSMPADDLTVDQTTPRSIPVGAGHTSCPHVLLHPGYRSGSLLRIGHDDGRRTTDRTEQHRDRDRFGILPHGRSVSQSGDG